MPVVKCEQVEEKFEGGPKLWRVALRYDSDLELEAFGQELSGALTKLAARVKGCERADSLGRLAKGER